MEEKQCSMCEQVKPLDNFHRQKTGKLGRHSYCADCFNAWKRLSRPTTNEARGHQPEQSSRWNLKSRYGLTPVDYEAMFASQGGVCAICQTVPARPCIDHNHKTGQVRGILCHYCNIRLAALEDASYLGPALAYLTLHAANDNQPDEVAA